jgi:hypothetical protein
MDDFSLEGGAGKKGGHKYYNIEITRCEVVCLSFSNKINLCDGFCHPFVRCCAKRLVSNNM